MEEIKQITNNFIQTFSDFTTLLWNSGIVGRIMLVMGVIGVAVIIAFGIINMTRGKRI